MYLKNAQLCRKNEGGRTLLSLIIFAAIIYAGYYAYTHTYKNVLNITTLQQKAESLFSSLSKTVEEKATSISKQLETMASLPTGESSSTPFATSSTIPLGATQVQQPSSAPGTPCPIINTSLKNQFEDGEKILNQMHTELETLQKTVEEGRATGQTMNNEAEIYNQKFLEYQKKFSEIESLRLLYNAQVGIFNTCLKSSKSQ